jgi:hypothetical protein
MLHIGSVTTTTKLLTAHKNHTWSNWWYENLKINTIFYGTIKREYKKLIRYISVCKVRLCSHWPAFTQVKQKSLFLLLKKLKYLYNPFDSPFNQYHLKTIEGGYSLFHVLFWLIIDCGTGNLFILSMHKFLSLSIFFYIYRLLFQIILLILN